MPEATCTCALLGRKCVNREPFCTIVESQPLSASMRTLRHRRLPSVSAPAAEAARVAGASLDRGCPLQQPGVRAVAAVCRPEQQFPFPDPLVGEQGVPPCTGGWGGAEQGGGGCTEGALRWGEPAAEQASAGPRAPPEASVWALSAAAWRRWRVCAPLLRSAGGEGGPPPRGLWSICELQKSQGAPWGPSAGAQELAPLLERPVPWCGEGAAVPARGRWAVRSGAGGATWLAPAGWSGEAEGCGPPGGVEGANMPAELAVTCRGAALSLRRAGTMYLLGLMYSAIARSLPDGAPLCRMLAAARMAANPSFGFCHILSAMARN